MRNTSGKELAYIPPTAITLPLLSLVYVLCSYFDGATLNHLGVGDGDFARGAASTGCWNDGKIAKAIALKIMDRANHRDKCIKIEEQDIRMSFLFISLYSVNPCNQAGPVENFSSI